MSSARLVLAAELRQLARDRRALFAAVLLPALLYPLVFWASKKLDTVGKETMAEREVTALLDLSGAVGGPTGDVARRARLALAAAEPIVLEERDLAPLLELAPTSDEEGVSPEARERGLGMLGPEAHVLVSARPSPESAARTRFELWYDVQDDVAREALGRARRALRELGATLEVEARERLLGGDPGAGLSPRGIDVASAEDKSGAALGRWLPFLAIFVLISGGAYAALAVFAGEREAGTLETLLVQPVPHTSVALGKFLAVLFAGVVTVTVNLASLVTCAVTGIAELPGFEGAGAPLPTERLIGAGLVLLGPSALLTALLCLVCGRARTFREGQMLLLPVTLAVILPTAIVLRPEASLGFVSALVPFAGSGLALREALEGDLTLALGALVLASHLGWTVLLLGRVAHSLDGERALRDGRGSEAGTLGARAARHAQLASFAVVMALYLVGGAVQRADLDVGLVVTFWALLPAAAVLIARLAPRPEGALWTRELGLRLPRAAHVLGAVLTVPLLAGVANWWLPVQLELLPMPREALEAQGLMQLFADRPAWWLAFFFALSPGLWEELVFRGAILSSARRGLSAWRVVLWQGTWFALAHASVYRLAPTFVLGLLFSAIALRAGSIWPTVLAHTAYNGLLVLGANGSLPTWAADFAGLGSYQVVAAGVGLALLAFVQQRAGAKSAAT